MAGVEGQDEARVEPVASPPEVQGVRVLRLSGFMVYGFRALGFRGLAL